MTQTSSWQSPNFLKIFARYDRADFAQEFLRRSPAYRADHAALVRASPRAASALWPPIARRWGLLFRR